jgi:O-methyltransferase
MILAYETSRKAGLKCKLWGFDTFEGLPKCQGPEDDHPKWVQGTMREPVENVHQHVRWRGLQDGKDYELVPGLYRDSLIREGLPSDLCLAYVDCDLYSSTREVLRFLGPRFKHGMIIGFDDYFCYSADQMSGERRASVEIFTGNTEWNFVPYIQFGWFGMSFVVEAKTLAHDALGSGDGKL